MLIVDGDPVARSAAGSAVSAKGYRFLDVVKARAAMVAARAHRADLVTLELALPDGDGIDFPAAKLAALFELLSSSEK